MTTIKEIQQKAKKLRNKILSLTSKLKAIVKRKVKTLKETRKKMKNVDLLINSIKKLTAQESRLAIAARKRKAKERKQTYETFFGK